MRLGSLSPLMSLHGQHSPTLSLEEMSVRLFRNLTKLDVRKRRFLFRGRLPTIWTFTDCGMTGWSLAGF